MPKEVTFNDTVQVRKLSVDLPTHIQEIKNPQTLIQVVRDKRVKVYSYGWLICITLVMIITMILFLIRRR